MDLIFYLLKGDYTFKGRMFEVLAALRVWLHDCSHACRRENGLQASGHYACPRVLHTHIRIIRPIKKECSGYRNQTLHFLWRYFGPVVFCIVRVTLSNQRPTTVANNSLSGGQNAVQSLRGLSGEATARE